MINLGKGKSFSQTWMENIVHLKKAKHLKYISLKYIRVPKYLLIKSLKYYFEDIFQYNNYYRIYGYIYRGCAEEGPIILLLRKLR